MRAQSRSTTAIVLDRAPHGEHWSRLLAFSAELGHLDVLQRLSHRTAATLPPLDLFDEAQLGLETRNDGRTWFLREALVLRKRPRLGASYAALSFACRFGRVLGRNPAAEEARAGVYHLLQRALDAWEAGPRPDAVYFKSLYVFARDEGYPVAEQWKRGLRPSDAATVDAILRQPAAAQETSAPEIERLTGALEAYLRQETEIQLES